MQEGDLTKEQIEEEIRRIKDAHAEDEGTSLSSIIKKSGLSGDIINFMAKDLCMTDANSQWLSKTLLK